MFTKRGIEPKLDSMLHELHRLARPLAVVKLTFVDGHLAGQEIEADIFTKHIDAARIEPLRARGLDELDLLYAAPWQSPFRIIRYRRAGKQLYLETE